MMYCPACGNQMHEAAAACPACGRPNAMAAAEAESTSWFSFRGRISRKVYWLHYALPLTVIPLFAGFVDGALKAHGLLSGIVALLLFIPNLAGSIKRAHDRDRSGWFLLVGLIPLIGFLWVLIELGFMRGTAGPNRFGGDPVRLTTWPPYQPA